MRQDWVKKQIWRNRWRVGEIICSERTGKVQWHPSYTRVGTISFDPTAQPRKWVLFRHATNKPMVTYKHDLFHDSVYSVKIRSSRAVGPLLRVNRWKPLLTRMKKKAENLSKATRMTLGPRETSDLMEQRLNCLESIPNRGGNQALSIASFRPFP